MNTIASNTPLFVLLTSALLPIFILLFKKHQNLREMMTFLAGFLKLGLVISMVQPILAGKLLTYELFRFTPSLSLNFRVDAAGLTFAIVASVLWILTSLFAIGYMRGLKEHSQTRFFSFFALSLSATMGVAFSGNLLTLYLFYEILSLSTYPLVTHHQNAASKTSGRKYLTYILGTSIGFVLPATIFSYATSGTLDFNGGGFLNPNLSSGVLTFVFVLFIFGFAKSGLMPFHSWLPAAMVAPTPVSSLLHAVAVVKVGVFSTYRVVTEVFGVDLLKGLLTTSIPPSLILCAAASITIVVSSLIALTQDELKRRLAFSTIGQLSYILLGLGLLSQVAVKGALLHIVMHAFGKITLFFCAGAIYVNTKIKNISQMNGLGKKMPVTMGAFFIGSLSVIGLPPLGGFLSKWSLLNGAFHSGYSFFMIVFLVSSLLNIAYFYPIMFNAFFKKAPEDKKTKKLGEASFCLVFPPVMTAFISFLLFLFPGFFLKLANLAVSP